MKRLVWIIALLCLAPLLHTASFAAPQPLDRASDAAVQEFLIKFDPATTPAQKAAALRSVGGKLVDAIPELGIEVARVDRSDSATTIDANAIMAAVAASDQVTYIEPNALLHTAVADRPDQTAAQSSTVFLPQVQGAGAFVPNDLLIGEQYAWQRIEAYRGWQIQAGSPNVVVAVIDTGVQLDHPDLRSKLVAGYDFVENDTTPSDLVGHGTHVAGTIGAATNNGIGVAGACPACRIMPVRVLDQTGFGSSANVIKGILYAADQGAQVINLSLAGGKGSVDIQNRTIESAINYAWNKGVFLACAAGNNGTSSTTGAYPAAFDRCFAVGATNSDDQRAYFSNYGTWVEIAAPGQDIYSTSLNNGYARLSGTSMATPHVAGVAGLLKAQGLTNAQIESRLANSADRINGTGSEWSNGRLNLRRAVGGS